ncbi:hypothetical protein ASD99_21615 [Mesorhizobium sp. Root695]|uniref:hypothetical protein n=1 Tax=Mesorhizobium sp. Root695 TaxID=1736589 RepID=UPI00070E5ADD|nr:hypothetical protein [Mesorhizobium sp. Root695]KRB31009.1 hypothetical protein ASD99_21615 [Mesorhizobium sp. Root695]
MRGITAPWQLLAVLWLGRAEPAAGACIGDDGVCRGSGGASFGGTRSVSTNPGYGTDGGGERRDIVKHAGCNEVVGPAGVVLTAFAGADQDTVT